MVNNFVLHFLTRIWVKLLYFVSTLANLTSCDIEINQSLESRVERIHLISSCFSIACVLVIIFCVSRNVDNYLVLIAYIIFSYYFMVLITSSYICTSLCFAIIIFVEPLLCSML